MSNKQRAPPKPRAASQKILAHIGTIAKEDALVEARAVEEVVVEESIEVEENDIEIYDAVSTRVVPVLTKTIIPRAKHTNKKLSWVHLYLEEYTTSQKVTPKTLSLSNPNVVLINSEKPVKRLRCILHDYVGCSAKHPETISVNEHQTTNYRDHFEFWHNLVFNAMEKGGEEGEDPKHTQETLLKAMKKIGKMTYFTSHTTYFLESRQANLLMMMKGSGTLVTVAGQQILTQKQKLIISECLWFTYSHIPPYSVENVHFQNFQTQARIATCGSSTLAKFILSLGLLFLKRFVIYFLFLGNFSRYYRAQQLCQFQSFFTTNDMWTSVAGHKYLAITYHAITPDKKFVPWNATLDLIPVGSRTFSETLVCIMDSRRSYNNLTSYNTRLFIYLFFISIQ